MLRGSIILAFAVVFALALSCGETEKTPVPPAPEFTADKCLPEKAGGYTTDSTSISRTPEELTSRLGVAGAGICTSYGTLGMAARSYHNDQTGHRLSVEIMEFDRPLDAFGYYARTRPAGIDTLTLGVEAYYLGNSLNFIQDQYTVTLSSMGATDDLRSALLPVAITISAMIQRNPPPPQIFGLFPDDGRIVPSGRFDSERYLEIPGLGEIYSEEYVIDGDSLTLFVARDVGGTKMLALMQAAGGEASASQMVPPYGFDEGYGVYFVHVAAGPVLAGLKNGWLVGTSGYHPERHRQFVADWIKRWERTSPEM